MLDNSKNICRVFDKVSEEVADCNVSGYAALRISLRRSVNSTEEYNEMMNSILKDDSKKSWAVIIWGSCIQQINGWFWVKFQSKSIDIALFKVRDSGADHVTSNIRTVSWIRIEVCTEGIRDAWLAVLDASEFQWKEAYMVCKSESHERSSDWNLARKYLWRNGI